MNKTVETIDMMIGYRRRSSGYNGSISRHINISATDGELIAVAGPNGAGKSTLLRTLAGLQKQVDGKIFLCGKSILDYSRKELAQTVSFVSTETIAVPYLKVFDFAAMGRYPYTRQIGQLSLEDKIRITEALELVGMHQMMWRNVDTLSDGERQRVMIARTLVQDTPIVLFDEPTAYLDISNKYDMLALLKRLAYKQGKTIIYSTHDVSLAISTADKLWLIFDASIHEGAPEEFSIQNVIKQLFNCTNVEYDRTTGEIIPKAFFASEVEIFTKHDPRPIRNILTRIGYQCILNPSFSCENLPKITFVSKKNNITIGYSFDNEEHEFTSFYEFGAFMKNVLNSKI